MHCYVLTTHHKFADGGTLTGVGVTIRTTLTAKGLVVKVQSQSGLAVIRGYKGIVGKSAKYRRLSHPIVTTKDNFLSWNFCTRHLIN